MGYFAIFMLAAAGILLVAAEWPRLTRILPARGPSLDKPRSRKSSSVANSEALDFSASVQRDLDSLSTISEDELRRKL
jgi:hypothetical protein